MQSVRDAMQAQQQEEPELVIADARYQTIADICETTIDNSHSEPNKLTAAMDRIVLNRWLGVPVFLFVMYLMFVLAINIGGALQPLFEGGSEAIFINGTQWLGMTLGFGLADHFPRPGVGGGINTVLPLVPQIGMMYLFLSFWKIPVIWPVPRS